MLLILCAICVLPAVCNWYVKSPAGGSSYNSVARDINDLFVAV